MGDYGMNTQTAISIVKLYVQKLKQNGIPVEQAIIFGSQAKGSAHKWSDIDTCIVSPVFGRNRHTERVRLMLLTDQQTDSIEPHPYNPKDLQDIYDPLASEIRKYGIPVID